MEIKNYAVRYHGGPQGSGEGIRGQIHLLGQQNRLVGWLDFYDAGRQLPRDHKTAQGHIVLSFYFEAMFSVVDILRNEKPIYLYWQESIQNGYLGTGQEPVGEGERSVSVDGPLPE